MQGKFIRRTRMSTTRQVNFRTQAMGQVRIISGKWRGRLVKFPPVSGLRPTPSRLRGTLFNWLVGQVQDSRCLDLFAGSGALGFECLSRGALEATFVESHPRVVAALRQTAMVLAAQSVQILESDALKLLRGAGLNGCYDLVFVDPPFQKTKLLSQVLQVLPSCLAPDALVYLEMPKHPPAPVSCLPFKVLKKSVAGDVCGCLLSIQDN